LLALAVATPGVTPARATPRRRADRGARAARPAHPSDPTDPAHPTPAADPTPVQPKAAIALGEAFRAYDRNDLAAARAALAPLADRRAEVRNRDYLAWLRGMVALRSDDPATAERAFRQVGAGSRFAAQVPWRLADCAWARGDLAAAARAYEALLAAKDADLLGDLGTALYRIAEARAATPAAAMAALRRLVLEHAAHPLAPAALARLALLGGPAAATLSDGDHIERARHLTDAHLWDDAVAELALVADDAPAEVRHLHDYWLGETLFKMRRRYGEAGQLLLAVVPFVGNPAEAMFHGARALSRADQDDAAITWYRKVVATYPSTAYAQEAQFLAGWLEFNRGHYRDAIAPLEESLRRYPGTKWVDDALWFLGLSHFFLGEWDAARERLEALGKRGGALEGGKGQYWLARTDERLGGARLDEAVAGYRAVIKRFPFSWYALLAGARLAARGEVIGPFGVDAPTPRGPALAGDLDEGLASDDLIARVDELIAAGLGVDAGLELERGEKPFLKGHPRGPALALMLDRYRRAGDFGRPWMIAVSYSGSALDGPAEGDARRWWEAAYPRAYRELIERHQALGHNPEGYLYSIMRKESGFNPHDISYADAQGLLQMIPPTTMRVVKEIGLRYDDGKLYEPEFNIQTGSWYIGHMLAKFKSQIPIGAGSFNSGPRPVMKWLDQNGDREIDEFVELVPYTQTREYMKKVTENYARYRYLYAGELYEQPLAVDKHYVVDALTY
jgi:soluble lytic murein transglycosylase